jgi:hypothetical protein
MAEYAPDLPEICCDMNAAWTNRLFFSTCVGTQQDLARLGLTPEKAIGKRFLFNSGDDTNPAGELSDIMFVGTFARSADYGIVIQMDDSGDIFWRSHRDGTISR